MKATSFLTMILSTAFGFGGALAQEHGSVPGAIPDPSTYKGSMELQRPQPSPWGQPSAGPAAPSAQAGAGGGGSSAAVASWRTAPRVSEKSNRLLGRWQLVGVDMGAAPNLGPLAGLFGKETAAMAKDMADSIHGASCRKLFGPGLVDFRPKALVNLGPDGSDRAAMAAEYRTDGKAIAVLSNEPALPGLYVFDVHGDQAVARVLGCSLQRAGAAGALASHASTDSSGAQNSTTARPGSGAALDVTVGLQAGAGSQVPVAGANVLLMSRSLDEALASAGLRDPTPLKAWMSACQTRAPACQLGMQAIVANPAGMGRTDANGQLVFAHLPIGRVYVLLFAAAGDQRLMWDVPVDLKTGSNAVSLGRHNAIRPPA